MIEITRLRKSGGPLTKRISLTDDGKVHSDGSACVMSIGEACRVRMPDHSPFAALIEALDSDEAISLGRLRDDLPDRVQITTKRSLDELNGSAAPDLIARTADHIHFRESEPALALLDIDIKSMPPAVASAIEVHGGYREALVSVLPGLERAGSILRQSTSSGLARTDTGEAIPTSGGAHWYVSVADGGDIERFLKTLHERCWLHGLGWFTVGASGQLLDRSLIDRTVFAPERLVFEGAPIVMPPLTQDRNARRPVVIPGKDIDTRSLCPDLSQAEQARLCQARDAAAYGHRSQRAEAKAAFIDRQADAIIRRRGVPRAEARRIVERQCAGVLLPAVALSFDSSEFDGATVADVLTDSGRFVGAALADPLEGPDYGRGKAKVMQRPDGSLWINSFAHGRTTYELKHDAATIEAAIQKADPKEAPDVLLSHLLQGDVEPDCEQRLRDLTSKISGVKARALAAKIKAGRERQAEQRAKAKRERRAAGRSDSRLRISAPVPNAERLPILRTLDEVLGAVADAEPPMRDLAGRPVEVRSRQPLLLHELTCSGSNDEEGADTRLPPPELPLLTTHDKFSMAHMIERHVEFVSGDEKAERSVALHPAFIEHFMAYRDSTLPRVGGIVTSPLVLADGALLAPNGLDRDRKLVFRIEPSLLALLRAPEECGPEAVAKAMDFLLNEWLVDVSADFTSKCVLVAAALTILERVLLPQRPAFFVTAGQRGGGKTTAVVMLVLAVTGKKPAAAAWSPNEEERRKALIAYLAEGLAALTWDNISRGFAISCPHIERALTAAEICDRLLGSMEVSSVPSTTVHLFTGNNIAPCGDMASRSLLVRIAVNRPDPENRSFKHADPIAWTLCNRGAILQALYTLLLGNPQLKPECRQQQKTRFKTWWHLVGSAIENAAALLVRAEKDLPLEQRQATPVDFGDEFNELESEDEQTSGLAGVLEILSEVWPKRPFLAAEVAALINAHMNGEDGKGSSLRSNIEQASGRPLVVASSVAIGKRLAAFLDAPVQVGEALLVLRRMRTANPGGKKHDVARFIVAEGGREPGKA